LHIAFRIEVFEDGDDSVGGVDLRVSVQEAFHDIFLEKIGDVVEDFAEHEEIEI
jgi:hypothetical protein